MSTAAAETTPSLTDPNKPGPEVKGTKVYRLVDSVRKALYVLGSCLLVFVAARNSFHWQITRFWGATGSFWQSQWNHMYENWFNGNEATMAIVGTIVLTSSVFWFFNFFLILLDLYGIPAWLQKYKIQEDKNVDSGKFWKAVRLVLFNQTVIGIPFSYMAYHLMRWRGCSVNGELPTFTWVVFEIFIFSLVEEFFFYYSHRLLHHPRLYKHIHKIHHEWTAPTSIVGLYAHPFEHFLSNILPPSLGPIFMGSHLATAWLWFALALMSTSISHCGYHFPLFPSPEAHDFHHLKFNQNYGVLGVLDRLHGTDIQFRNSRQYQRHLMLLSLVPLKQQIPDSPKKKPE